MSYDFAVIPVAQFSTADEALRICEQLYAPSGSPPAALAELIDQLERDDAMGDDGFLSMWPVDAGAQGAVLCTRGYADLTHTLLELTKDRGLAVIDVQFDRLFDPRDRVEVHVSLGSGVDLPYLTAAIVRDLVSRPHHRDPWLVVHRDEHDYVQAYFPPDGDCVVEYRAGGPDRHYRARSTDRDVVQKAVWDWTTHGPDRITDLEWTRVDPKEFEG